MTTQAISPTQPAAAAPSTWLATRLPGIAGLLTVPGFLQISVSNGMAHALGMRLQSLAVAWLVLELTGSHLWLGLINGLPAFSVILFSLLGGALADAWDARRLLIATRSALAVASLLAALLSVSGLVRPEYLLLYVLLTVGLAAMDMPAARTLTQRCSGPQRLLSANALQSVFMNLVNIAGPVSMGLLIGLGGPGGAFALLAAGYGFSALLLRRTEPSMRKRPAGTAGRGDVLAGLRYVAANPNIAALVGLGFLLPVAGIYFALVPVVAREALHAGASGLGLLAASFAGGGLVSTTYLAANGKMRHRGPLVLVLGLVFGGGMIAFAHAGSLPVACGISVVMGLAAGLWQTNLSSLVQLAPAPEMRGRVVSLYTMGFQLAGLGWLISGAMTSVVGIEATLLAGGLAFAGLNTAAIALSNARKID